MGRRKFIKIALIAAGAVAFAAIFFKYVLSLILPFVIAFFIAFLLHYPIDLLKKRTRISSKILSSILVSLVIFLLGFTVFLLINRLITETSSLIATLSENSDLYVGNIFAVIDNIAKKLPFIDAIGADLTDTVSEVVRGMLKEATSRLPSVIADIIAMLPHILIFTVIIILASYYFTADYDAIKENLLSFLPEGARKSLHSFKSRLADTGVKYLKACFIILVITYFELLTGFLMLGIPYAFSLALIVAAVDMLPIFGVGTVLVPFAIWHQLTGDTYTAIGLIIIFAVVTVVRQFIEPKIIGNGIGISPLATLFAMYLGFRLFGLAGLLFSPLAAVLILHALPENIAKKLGFKKTEDKKGQKSKT